MQEGNKRVSVLKHMGATRIPGIVKRIHPVQDQSPAVRAYSAFLEFYRVSGIYTVQFRSPADFGKLLSLLGKEPGEVWTERERRTFSAYYQYFKEAFAASEARNLPMYPEEALLLWLQVYPFKDLGRMADKELKKTISALQDDLWTFTRSEAPVVSTEPEVKAGLLSRITAPSHVHVAFVHPLDTKNQ